MKKAMYFTWLLKQEREIVDLTIGKCKMEFTDIKLVALFNTFSIDAVALEFDAVGRVEIFDVISAIFKDNRTMLARNIAVANDEIGEL